MQMRVGRNNETELNRIEQQESRSQLDHRESETRYGGRLAPPSGDGGSMFTNAYGNELWFNVQWL